MNTTMEVSGQSDESFGVKCVMRERKNQWDLYQVGPWPEVAVYHSHLFQ